MYLALVQPWANEATPPPPAGAPVAIAAPADAGAPAKKKRKRPRARIGNQDPGGLGVMPGDNSSLPTIDSSFGPDGQPEEYEETDPFIELTSADRRMETRGDDVSLPPTKIDMEGGNAARKLDESEISAVVASQAGGIRTCVIQGATNTDLSARISVEMVIGGNGRVQKTRISAPHYLFEKGLLSCVKSAAGKMKFPATGAATLVTVPVSLS
jgi:hypothetical protein